MKFIHHFFILSLFMILSCGEPPGGQPNAPAATAGTDPVEKAIDGEEIYKIYCVACHGMDGKLGLNGAKDLGESLLSREEQILVVTKGRNAMTPFESVLTKEQIEAVVSYVQTFSTSPE